MDIEEKIGLLEARIVELEDREAIRDVMHRYCRAVDRADTELLMSCYWEDGLDDHGFFSGNAHEFAKFLTPLLRVTNSTTHSVTNPLIELDGDRAYTECQVDVIHRLADEDSQVSEWGQCRYIDVFEKRNNEWRIYVRIPISDGINYIKLDMETVAIRSKGRENSLIKGARYPDDPVYSVRNVKDMVRELESTKDFWSSLKAVKDAL